MSYFFKFINPKWALQPMSYLPFILLKSTVTFSIFFYETSKHQVPEEPVLNQNCIGQLVCWSPMQTGTCQFFRGFHETFTSIGVEVSRSNVFALLA